MRINNDLVRIAVSFLPGLFLVLALWAVKMYEWLYECRISDYGLFPRTLSGLRGIITMPFLHGDFEHLISNSIPLLVLITGLVYFYKRLALKVTIWIWLLSGFWLWLGGRPSFHIGASAVIYGLTVFLFFSGVFRKDRRLMALSLLVVFLYGGLIWGILPIVEEHSWEGHLFGSCAGLLMAIIYKKQGPQRPAYSWEVSNDAEVEDGPDAYWRTIEEKVTETNQDTDSNKGG
jgi:membrane associated rhomboid family serine protease